jgi:Holliday junction resolvase-like predicted endonuclease
MKIILLSPQYAVHKIKQRLIIYAANYYLVSNKIENWAKCRVRHIVAIPSFENIAAIFVKIFNRSKSYA